MHPAPSQTVEETEQLDGRDSRHAHGNEAELSDQAKELAHFQSVIDAFDAYLPYSLAANNARRRSYYSLPRSHRTLLGSLGQPLPGPLLADVPHTSTEFETATTNGGRGFKARLDEIDDRIRRNADVLSQIVEDSRATFTADDGGDTPAHAAPEAGNEGNGEGGSQDHQAAGRHASARRGGDGAKAVNGVDSTEDGRLKVPMQDVDKVRSTLKQFVRDWSSEGITEREMAYGPILDALEALHGALPFEGRSNIKVLVPGAGLGRLSFEIAFQGYACQGNEFSFFMLFASHFVLNKTSRPNERAVYPFVHSLSNLATSADALRAVTFPDVDPNELPAGADFSMVAGEFVEVYSKPNERGAWSDVATCFFLDTAKNVVRYVETINHVLALGGHWINVGPLLWHYEGQGGTSIELALDEVLELVERLGFQIVERRSLPPQTYTGDGRSMLSYMYRPYFFCAKKLADVSLDPSETGGSRGGA